MTCPEPPEATDACNIGCTPACMSTAVYIRVFPVIGQKTGSQRAEPKAWLKRQRLKP